MRHLSCLLLIAIVGPLVGAGETDARLYAFVDVLPDESDIEVSNGGASSTVEGNDWDDHWRAGIGMGTQHLMSDAGGPLLTYGFELGYNRYRAEDDGEEFEGEAVMVTPHIGIGFHALEWLFLEAGAFAGIGLSGFEYRNETFDFEEESDGELATEYGLYATGTVALAETLLLGLRLGWIEQQLEGEFDGNALVDDTTVESDTSGAYYGLMAGFRF